MRGGDLPEMAALRVEFRPSGANGRTWVSGVAENAEDDYRATWVSGVAGTAEDGTGLTG